ncbi:MAG: T9SS type A sorting domain-containing protein [Salibacteraceae bacterium]
MIKGIASILLFGLVQIGWAQYDPAVGQTGSLAISKDSSIIKSWVSHCTLQRGYKDIADKSLGLVDYGKQAYVLGFSDPKVLSLGDSGVATLTYNGIVYNGPGADFCIFENSFNDNFLELAHVEVSSNGVDFFRFPSVSLTSTQQQKGSFDLIDPTHINNLAGKHRGQYGTPFDLNDLKDSLLLNTDSITHIRIIDVVGSIDSSLGSRDGQGNLINDPYPTAFTNEGYYTGGFDLDAIGLINYEGEIYLGKPYLSYDSSIKFYPNPAVNNINFTNDHIIKKIEVYTLSGIEILERNNEEISSLDVSEFPSGVYILHIYSADLFSTVRLIKK